jgi:uncharacterized protein (DUF1330 family)
MPKGYWIAHVEVTDEAEYGRYRELNGIAFAKYGGRFLVRGGTAQAAVGPQRSRNVVLEFPSYRAALDCLHSAEYAAAVAHRDRGAKVELVVAEGYEGAQPA